MSTLHIDSINKSYGNNVVLSDVYLSCQKGDVVGLIGRNGSGKTTLLKIVFGIENADSKFVRLDGEIIKNVTDGRHLINYLPQENFLPNNVKIRKLITLFLSTNEREKLFKNELVQPLLEMKSQSLSGGEKRLIEILLILHSNAKFVLLDEPFNGVSPIVKDYFIKYIKKMKSSKGFIITDHDFENVVALSDRMVFLNNGFLKEIKNKNELVDLGYLTKSTYDAVYR